jgi:hypothetical protein
LHYLFSILSNLISFRNDDNSLEPIELDWYCRWLYTARSDGRPRVLMFSTRYCPNGISSIIDRIKQVYFKWRKNYYLIFSKFQTGFSHGKPSNQLFYLHL